jgi:hypothetical protein
MPILIVGVSVAAFLVLSASARAQDCPRRQEPVTVSFETVRPEVKYNNALNVTGLRNLLREKGGTTAGAHAEALGVTFVTPSFTVDAKTVVMPVQGGVCVYLERVHAKVGYRSMDVYVASEYPPGTCENRAIVDHENQHIAINLEALAEFAPKIRAELERIVAAEKPVRTTDGKRGTRQLVNRVSDRMSGALDRFHSALRERNARIDSASNYAAIGGLCSAWDRGNVWPRAK